MPATVCQMCGRELSPAWWPGAWTCEPCRQKLPKGLTVGDFDTTRASAPPPMPKPEPEPAESVPPASPDPSPEPGTEMDRSDHPAVAVATALPVVVAGSSPGDEMGDLQRIWKLGRWLALMELDGDKALTPQLQAAGAMRFYLAEQYDLPATAASEIAIIDGKPYPSGRLLRILALRQGYRVVPRIATAEECEAVLMTASGVMLGDATYTIQDAQAAGLIGRPAYRKDPRAMLWARAARRVLDYYAPNVLFALRLVGIDPPATATPLRDRDLEFHGEHDPDLDPEADEDIPF